MQCKDKLTMRQEQAAETKRNLLDAALRLFAENGYSATTVRDINRTAGMADGLLYHYFPDGKKEILLVLVEEKIGEIRALLRSGAEGLDALPLDEALEQVFQNWFEVFHTRKDVIKILLKENEAMQIVEREKLAEIIHRGDKWFPEFLRKRAQKGEIREIDYVSASESLGTVLYSYFLTMLTGIGSGLQSDEAHRKKLIAYQVDLWKNPQS